MMAKPIPVEMVLMAIGLAGFIFVVGLPWYLIRQAIRYPEKHGVLYVRRGDALIPMAVWKVQRRFHRTMWGRLWKWR